MGERAEMKEFQLLTVLTLLELMINIYFYTCSLIDYGSFLLKNLPSFTIPVLICWKTTYFAEGFLFSFCVFWQAALIEFCRRQ